MFSLVVRHPFPMSYVFLFSFLPFFVSLVQDYRFISLSLFFLHNIRLSPPAVVYHRIPLSYDVLFRLASCLPLSTADLFYGVFVTFFISSLLTPFSLCTFFVVFFVVNHINPVPYVVLFPILSFLPPTSAM